MPSCHLGLSAFSHTLSLALALITAWPGRASFSLEFAAAASLSYRSKHVGILFARAGHSALGLAILTSFLIRLCVQLGCSSGVWSLCLFVEGFDKTESGILRAGWMDNGMEDCLQILFHVTHTR
jgi:hypothetical protein